MGNNDIYIMMMCTGNAGAAASLQVQPSPRAQHFIDEFAEQSAYECNNAIYKQLKRYYLGDLKFACLYDDYAPEHDDGSEVPPETRSQTAMLILTTHERTNLNILTLAVPQNTFDVTSLLDQVATAHIFVSDQPGGAFVPFHRYAQEKLGLTIIGDAKSIVCLDKKPDTQAELCAMLASEAYASKHVNYTIKSKLFENFAADNLAQYSFYEAYASRAAIVYIIEGLSNNYLENIKWEIAMLFICELILLQHAAIIRTNNRITEELTSGNQVSIKIIEALHADFGRTNMLWNSNNFKYILVQSLSELISRAFQTDELLKSYNRNLSHLEHLVEIRSTQANERENKILSCLAILIAVIQIVPILVDFYRYLHQSFDVGQGSYLETLGGFGLFLLLLIILRKKQKKNRLRQRMS